MKKFFLLFALLAACMSSMRAEFVHDTIQHTMCEGSYYLFNGMHLTESGIYADSSFVGASGQDSVVVLVLTVAKPFYKVIHEDIFEGNAVEFYGAYYHGSGVYSHTEKTADGCDSTTVLELVVHPYVNYTYATCQFPVRWSNYWTGEEMIFYAPGVYRMDTVINGEKRFYGLEIIEKPIIYEHIQHTICSGDAFLFDGEYRTQTGQYYAWPKDIYSGEYMECPDTVTILDLRVKEPYFETRTQHHIGYYSEDWMSEPIWESFVETYTGKTTAGCDSTVEIQHIIHPWTDTVITVCSNDLPYVWTNRWTGNPVYLHAAGHYRIDTTFYQGQQMFYGIELRVTEPVFDTIRYSMNNGSTYQFAGQTLTEGGIYHDTLVASSGCDSIVTLVFYASDYEYIINVAASRSDRGTVSGSGIYKENEQAVLTATPKRNYHFEQWNDGNTDNPRNVTITSDTTFIAEFAIDKSGNCGDELALIWAFNDEENTLSIQGEGALNSNYTFGVEAPTATERLVIEEGVTSIGKKAFANYETIQEISFPTTVKTIYQEAFLECINLRDIYCYRERPCVVYTNTFDGIDKFDCTLHVPGESLDMYRSATGWRDFYFIVALSGSTTDIEEVSTTDSNTTRKIIRNGQILIIRGDKVYTITGQEVQ